MNHVFATDDSEILNRPSEIYSCSYCGVDFPEEKLNWIEKERRCDDCHNEILNGANT